MPSIDGQRQEEASERFDEARRAVGNLLPDIPYFRELNKANLALGLGICAWFIIPALNLVAVALEQPLLSVMFIGFSCVAAIGAMAVGSYLGGRNAPVFAARLGYLLGLGWLSLWVLGAALLIVADGVLR